MVHPFDDRVVAAEEVRALAAGRDGADARERRMIEMPWTRSPTWSAAPPTATRSSSAARSSTPAPRRTAGSSWPWPASGSTATTWPRPPVTPAPWRCSAAGPTELPTVVVDDVTAALGLLARHVVDQLPERRRPRDDRLPGQDRHQGLPRPPAVRGRAHRRDPRQLQQRAGRAADRAPADPRHPLPVVEMGARGVGHVAELCAIAPPHVAAVLNVGTAHIGEFGSREAIAQAKGEIVEALPADGTAVLNADDDLVAAMAGRTAAQASDVRRTAAPARRRRQRGRRSTSSADSRSSWPTAAPAPPSTSPRSAPTRWRNAAAAAAMALAAGLDLDTVADRSPTPPVAAGGWAGRAPRRARRHQRRLQRQPRVDAARRSRRLPGSATAPVGVRSPCWARCSSSARDAAERTGEVGPTTPRGRGRRARHGRATAAAAISEAGSQAAGRQADDPTAGRDEGGRWLRQMSRLPMSSW